MELEQTSETTETHVANALQGAAPTSSEEIVRVTALCRFARSIGISEEIAITTYRQELRRLSSAAKVTSFVPLLVEKSVKDLLRTRAQLRI
jgi:hypothetical protein